MYSQQECNQYYSENNKHYLFCGHDVSKCRLRLSRFFPPFPVHIYECQKSFCIFIYIIFLKIISVHRQRQINTFKFVTFQERQTQGTDYATNFLVIVKMWRTFLLSSACTCVHAVSTHVHTPYIYAYVILNKLVLS